jgi:hypothetical protein
MNSSESFEALRRANPRARAGFGPAVDAAAEAVRARVTAASEARTVRPRASRRAVGVSVLGVSVAAAAVAVVLSLGSPGGGPGVESATAALKKAGTVTASSAERSGTARVRIMHTGTVWAASLIRWNGSDLALGRDTPQRPGQATSEFLVVDGMMYGIDPEGGWMELGPPSSIDPGSGTTPAEYLAAVREDVGGETLRRITGAMAGLTTTQLGGGSTAYSGTVAAGLIARESGFKEGQAIRVFPFGYVAHGAAADPSALLNVVVTVRGDGVVHRIAVSWPSWTYTIDYSKLGATVAPQAPVHPKPLNRGVPSN